jgi:hypothetical protein
METLTWVSMLAALPKPLAPAIATRGTAPDAPLFDV